MVGLGEHTWYWESTHGRIRRAHMVLGEHMVGLGEHMVGLGEHTW